MSDAPPPGPRAKPPAPPPGAERRKHERFELFAQVELRRQGDVEVLSVINISAGGVLLRNDSRFDIALGDEIHVFFDSPELGVSFAIDATVVRVVPGNATRPPAFAAMWASSDATSAASLSQLLWKLATSDS